jgi:hypothetical protein
MRTNVRDLINRDWRVQFAFEFVAGLYVLAVVLLLWRRPAWTFLLLAVGVAGQRWVWRDRADAVTMIVGAVLGTFAETLCVRSGVWTYYTPGLVLGVPVWLPLVWAYLLCLFRRASLTVHLFSVVVWPSARPILRQAVFGVLGLLILAYCVVTVVSVGKGFAIIYSALMIPAIIFWHRETDILLFIIAGILGTFGEYLGLQAGIWEYHFPFFRSLGVPISLPLAWGFTSVFASRAAGKAGRRG